jgi:hypothetical protein
LVKVYSLFLAITLNQYRTILVVTDNGLRAIKWI